MGARGGERTHDIIILNSIRLAPSAHHPRIIVGDHSDDVNALLALEGRELLDEAGEVAL